MEIDFIDKARKEFTSLVERAKMLVQDSKYIEDKWLSDPYERFESYLREYSSVKVRHGASIYDLGSGPGYLMWFLREFSGCKVRGLEPQRRKDYLALWNQLGLSESIDCAWIHPMQPVPYPASYDYIIGTRICFDRTYEMEPRYWNEDAYVYFIRDACNHLNPRGELYLRFNTTPQASVLGVLKEFGALEDPTHFRIRPENVVLSKY